MLLLSPKEERSTAASVVRARSAVASAAAAATPATTTAAVPTTYSRNEPHRISFTTSDDETSLGEQLSLPPLSPPRLVAEQQQQKAVRFVLEPTMTLTAATPRSSALTNDCREPLWYHRDELAMIKLEVKQVLAMKRQQQREQQQQHNQQHNEGGHDRDRRKSNYNIYKHDDNDTALVGLQRFNPQRATWKRSAIHYVLAAQSHLCKKYNSALVNIPQPKEAQNYVRSVSLRCTGWARGTAREQGYRDYCVAYDLDPSKHRRSSKNHKRKRNERPTTVDTIENIATKSSSDAERAR